MHSDDIQVLINKISLPVIELAGPSPHGFKVLKELNLSIPKPIVTNLTKKVVVYDSSGRPYHHTVERVVDIKNMPYKDSSLGIVLCSYLPLTDYRISVDLSDNEISTDYREIIKGNKRPAESFNLRIILFNKLTKVLANDGIFMFQGATAKDSKVAKMLGFRTLLSDKDAKLMDSQIYLK